MSETLSELFRGVAVHANADQEHKAALELLTLVMVADQSIDSAEIEAIRNISEEWHESEFSFERYLGDAVAIAQQAVHDDRVAEMIADIDERISSRILRRALFSAVREVACVDDELTAAEGSILAAVAVRFG